MSDLDFDKIARTAAMMFYGTMPQPHADQEAAITSLTARLRQVWNDRGAADRLAVADLLVEQPGNVAKPIQYVLKKLDIR